MSAKPVKSVGAPVKRICNAHCPHLIDQLSARCALLESASMVTTYISAHCISVNSPSIAPALFPYLIICRASQDNLRFLTSGRPGCNLQEITHCVGVNPAVTNFLRGHWNIVHTVKALCKVLRLCFSKVSGPYKMLIFPHLTYSTILFSISFQPPQEKIHTKVKPQSSGLKPPT